jgi:hypothetical protein
VRLFITLFLFFLTLPQAICAQSLSIEGLESYKLKLENHLDAKIRQAVKPIIEESQFTLSVVIIMKPTVEINRLINSALGNNGDLKNTSTDIFEFVQEKPKEEETLLPLTKLGLWQRKTTSNTSKNGTDNSSVNFITYKDFISKINLAFYTDRSVSTDVNRSLEQIIRNAAANFESNLNLQFTQLNIVQPKKPDPELEKIRAEQDAKLALEEQKRQALEKKTESDKKSFLNLLIEFKIAIALVFCCFMFLMLGYYITANFNRISARKMEILEKQAEREESVFRTKEIVEQGQNLNVKTTFSPLDEKTMAEKKTLISAKLNSYINSDQDSFSTMITNWIKFKNEGYLEALNFVARTVPIQNITTISEKLTDEDKAHWNQIIARGYLNEMEPTAVDFIEKQILMLALQPQTKIDEQLRGVINDVNFADIIKLMQTNIETGALILNFLNASQISKIFDTLDANTVAKISQAGMLLKPNISPEKIKELQTQLTQIKMQSRRLTDFGEKVQAIIKDVQIEKEEALFRALSIQMEKPNLVELARTQVPSEVIPSLPPDLLRRALNTFPLIGRAEFIIAQKSPRKEFILGLVGEGKNKEIIEEEIENIQMDQIRVAALQRSSEKYWKQFVLVIRSMIQKDESLQAELFPILSAWADRLIQTQSSRGGGSRAA